jgi:hypothetical protein
LFKIAKKVSTVRQYLLERAYNIYVQHETHIPNQEKRAKRMQLKLYRSKLSASEKLLKLKPEDGEKHTISGKKYKK